MCANTRLQAATSSRPDAIAIAPDGAVWFCETGAAGHALVRFVPATGRMQAFAIPGGGVTGMVAGRNGELWMTEAAAESCARHSLRRADLFATAVHHEVAKTTMFRTGGHQGPRGPRVGLVVGILHPKQAFLGDDESHGDRRDGYADGERRCRHMARDSDPDEEQDRRIHRMADDPIRTASHHHHAGGRGGDSKRARLERAPGPDVQRHRRHLCADDERGCRKQVARRGQADNRHDDERQGQGRSHHSGITAFFASATMSASSWARRLHLGCQAPGPFDSCRTTHTNHASLGLRRPVRSLDPAPTNMASAPRAEAVWWRPPLYPVDPVGR